MIVEINQAQIKSITDRLEKLGKKITANAILEQLTVKIKNAIFVRTISGKDIAGKPFEPYSTGYAKQEKKTTVNLIKTGRLMNSMTQKVLSNNTAKIFFIETAYPKNGMTTQKLAKIHNEEGAGKSRVVRNFFGLSDLDIDHLYKDYQNEVTKIKEEFKL